MSILELLLILVVALIAFGPKHLPMLAKHLAKLVRYGQHLKQQFNSLYEKELNLQQQLQDNEKRAAQADESYQQLKKE